MRKICVFTSTRAEYGLLRGVITEIHRSDHLQLQLLISGTHLADAYGMTINEIYKDGFTPDFCVDIDLNNDSPEGICKSIGKAVAAYGQTLSEAAPDILLLLGDRFEAFACSISAQVCRIPLAHIHGGETTEGAIDEAFRHGITKMAHFHFPCCDEYRRRIVQLGEKPESVFNVGALGVENIKRIKLLEKKELEESLQFPLDKPFFLVTFHSVTLENQKSGEQMKALLKALDVYQDHKLIMTYANSDTDGRIINQMLDNYSASFPERCLISPSLGYSRYLSAMRLCEAVIGNSSSGLLEAPALRVPTINVGDRQKGRIRTESIVDCEPETESILKAIKKIYTNDFKRDLYLMKIPFERENTAENIVKILGAVPLGNVLKKHFFDLPRA